MVSTFPEVTQCRREGPPSYESDHEGLSGSGESVPASSARCSVQPVRIRPPESGEL